MVSGKELNVYSSLYDIVRDNMESERLDFDIKKGVFLIGVNAGIGTSDLSLLRDVPYEDFVEASYELIFRRRPEKETLERLYAKAPADVWAWKRNLIEKWISSAEYSTKGLPISNNIFFENNYSIDLNLKRKIKAGIYKLLYGIYKKFPAHLKEILKKLARKMRLYG